MRGKEGMGLDECEALSTKNSTVSRTVSTVEFKPMLKEIVELRSLLFFTQEKNQQLEAQLAAERSVNACLEDYVKKAWGTHTTIAALGKKAANE